MKYQVTAQSNDEAFFVNADDMAEAYAEAEKQVGELDGNITNDAYSVAEGSSDYYTIAKIEE